MGVLTSPNFPNNYLASQHCIWLIDLGLGRVVKLTFEQFVLEKNAGCSFDFVRVELSNGTVLGTFCSTEIPPIQHSEGPMKITFKSDGSQEFPGFNATYLVTGE